MLYKYGDLINKTQRLAMYYTLLFSSFLSSVSVERFWIILRFKFDSNCRSSEKSRVYNLSSIPFRFDLFC